MRRTSILVRQWGLVFAVLTCIGQFGGGRVAAEGFDWRNVNGQNWVTSVKSQFGGTCWAFGSCATIESKYMLTRNDPNYKPDLSEQQVVWETNPDMGSTDGGSGDSVLTYSRDHGIVLQSECPYQSSSPDVGIAPYWPLAAGWENRVFKSTSRKLSTSSSVQAVKDALKKYGPMNFYLRVDDEFYSPAPGEYRGTHIVSIVGFQDDLAAPGGGYWIIKNSWGSGWNGDGYGKVAYAVRPKSSGDMDAIDGAVYYTGSMADATWKGGTASWTNAGNNWTVSGATFAWDNKETTANFSVANGANPITLSGIVIAHGLNVNAGATGYVFSPPSASTTGALTVTAGGIAANESVTINVPVTVGAPQTWSVASGKTLSINNAVHTIISNLTVTGDGNTEISGVIDGGGALNTYGAAPGNLTKSGTGSLLIAGASNYGGTIAISGGTLNFAPGAGVSATYSGSISGSGAVVKSGGGKATLTYSNNTYTGNTTISEGTLEANHDDGLPPESFLKLDGGVLQCLSGNTFTRSLGTSGSSKFQWAGGGGGFAAGSGAMTVKVNNGTGTINWGTAAGSGIVGTLKFGTDTAANVVTFQNGINLNGEDRTIQVDDNAATTADYAVISGIISNSTGTAGLVKTGLGKLILSGSNTYNGGTTIAAGTLDYSVPATLPGGNYAVTGGTLYFGAKSLVVAGLQVTAGLLDGSGTLTSNTNYDIQGGKVNMILAGGGRDLNKTGPAAAILSKNNTYDGVTTVSDGVLQADSGAGLPDASFLDLAGGVLQSNGPATFARPLGLVGNAFKWSAGGGFSAGAGPMTVQIGGGTETVAWGDAPADIGAKIVGTLKLSSATAADATDFQNGIDLAGANRTIQVEDNPATAADYAKISGNIVNTGVAAGIVKSGGGTLLLSGLNSYGGDTVISGGVLQADIGAGIESGSFLVLDGGVLQSNSEVTFTRSLGTSGAAFQWTSSGGGFSAGAGAMTVRIGGGTDTVAWGDAPADIGAKIMGTLKLSSTTAGYVTDFQNGIDLAGGYRTIQVDDNLAASTDYAKISGNIVNTGAAAGILKTGDGTLLLSGSNTYNGSTVISGGVLYANEGAGLPAGSFISLDGGVLQTDGGAAFTRNLGTSGNAVQWTTNGGGFAAAAATLTVNIGGAAATLNWGNTAGNNLAGTLKFGSSSAAGPVAFLNGIDLKGGARTIEVADNPATAADYAVLSGVIKDTTGGGTLTKTGPGMLRVSGSSANTYTGATFAAGGTLVLAKSSGVAVPGNLTITDADPAGTFVIFAGSNQIATTAVVAFNQQNGGSAHLQLMGNAQTLAGISCSTGTGVIENSQTETTATGTGLLTINNSADCSFHGYLRDTATGAGKIALYKDGAGKLSLVGSNSGSYTGGLTVRNGTLDYSGGALPACGYSITGGTLSIGALSKSITSFLISSGTVDGTGTLTSGTTFNIQGGTVNAVLGGSGIALTKLGSTTACLSGTNTYSGTTTISAGALQANTGAGLPAASFLILSGGVLQSNGTATFSRSLGTSGGAFQWASIGGGFAAGTGALTVNVNNNTSTLTWGTAVGSQIVGTLKFGSSTAANVVTFQNGIDLNGGARIIQVDDNSGTTADYAVLSGVIGNGVGAGTLNKTGAGTLQIGGSASNTYTGTTVFTGGALVLAKTSGAIAIPGNFTLTTPGDGTSTYAKFNASNQLAATSVMTFSPTSGYAHLELLGYSQTVAGLSCSTGRGVIENTQSESGITNNSVLTVNNTVNYSYNGYLRDRAGGTSTGTLALVKNGPGTLTLSGANITYTGNTTISGGALQANQGAGLSAGSYLVLNGGVLQSGSTLTFTRGLSAAAGGSSFYWTANGGGFSSGGGTMTVNVGGSGAGLVWGTALGTQIVGTLKFGSPTAVYPTYFQNPIDLNGGSRTVQVDDNPGASNDYALITGILSDSVGGAVLNKTGAGTLLLGANSSFAGTVVIDAGTLQFGNGGSTGGIAGNIVIDDPAAKFVVNRSDSCSYGGTISGTGSLLQRGAGTMTLSAADHCYTGGTTVQAGTLAFAGGLPGGKYTITGGTLNTGSFSQAIDAFQITGGQVLGSGTLTSSADYDIQGGVVQTALGGGSKLVKSQSGVAVLTGFNSYTGDTLIQAGTLVLSGNGQIDPLSLIDNSGTFLITDGSHAVGNIVGGGSTLVSDTAQLFATQIVQSALTVGGSSAAFMASAFAAQQAAVPEPGTFTLLALTLCAGFTAMPLRKKMRNIFASGKCRTEKK
ncbi:MAG: autotransporter-associated beta strand repeat-containing protein [Pirellulales bacterium]|nr:autotransporter-associated beta strand repeat-containing protein [Pirellulales bacterium]